ncbi:response regulator [Spirochaeta cellobiosiphila]|uniref:response regulator n=1 Tax=Spirochaeta cellobiosiphila TaxID=504483 RepID=UPI000401248F|nr:response regulator [Spirochaeta cellobiosiphila]
MAKGSKKVRIYSALEVANICGVVNQTAINWIKNDYLKAFTTPGGQYRVYAEDLVNFLQDRNMRIPDELVEVVHNSEEGKSILIIDDDKELNNLLKTYVERKLTGFTIYQAFDGYEAGSMLYRVRPSIVILDIDLPGVNGHVICKKIKSDADLGSPYIIAVTGMNDSNEERLILEEGADAFLGKPFDPSEVVTLIAEFIEK